MVYKKSKRKRNLISTILLFLSLSSFQQFNARENSNYNLTIHDLEATNIEQLIINSKPISQFYHVKTSENGMTVNFEVPISGKINESTQIFGDLTSY